MNNNDMIKLVKLFENQQVETSTRTTQIQVEDTTLEDTLSKKYADFKDLHEKRKDAHITELSTELLGKYKTAASKDASAADAKGDFKTGDKRFSGIVKATKKQFANDAKASKEKTNEQGVAEGVEKLDIDYFMNEGCGIFAMAKSLNHSNAQIYVISNNQGESWSKSFPYELTHVFVNIPNQGTFDVKGKRTPEQMASDFHLSKNDYSIKGPFFPKDFYSKFMGNSDAKPLYGTKQEIKQLQKQLQATQGVAEGDSEAPDLATLIRRNMERKAAKGGVDTGVSPSKVEKDIDAIAKDDVARERHQATSIVHKHGLGKMKKPVNEADSNPADTVTMDIPLVMRMMEYAREDASTDMDLHHVVEKMIELGKDGRTLSMQDYGSIVEIQNEQIVSELGATGSAISSVAQAQTLSPTTKPAATTQQTQANTSPTTASTSSSPTTQPASNTAPLNPDEQAALDKIMTNAGLKGQLQQLMQKAKTVPGA